MSSLDKRRDVRSVEQFKQDIKEATIREQKLLNIWIKEVSEVYGHKITFKNNGIDNSGEFVEHSNNDADYSLNVNGMNLLYEIKHNPFGHRMSFKVYDLESYIRQDARILLFYNISKNLDFSKDSRWAIIKPEAMKKLLTLPYITNDIKWGYKPIVKIVISEYSQYFKSFNFRKENELC